MADETPEIDETKRLATVGMAMGIGILTRLEAKGLLPTMWTRFLKAS
jgi:hypothetical protein